MNKMLIVMALSAVCSFLNGEESGGWMSLFDGKSFDGWQNAAGSPVSNGWVIENGCIFRKDKGGDIFTSQEFSDFELELEWKIAPKGNSGIKYRVKKINNSNLGPEYQVLDDDGHGNGKNPLTSAAAMYEMFQCNDQKELKPVGEFNKTRIVAKGTVLEHWLNGKKVLEVDMASTDWAEHKAKSKFKNAGGYGEGSGRIMLQDHGDQVWFKNIRIRKLNK